jgi:hypothetical protein
MAMVKSTPSKKGYIANHLSLNQTETAYVKKTKQPLINTHEAPLISVILSISAGY